MMSGPDESQSSGGSAVSRLAPLVDTHAHVFRRDLPFIPVATHHFDRDFTIEDYLSELDNYGVRYGVIAAPSFLGTYYDYTLEALEKNKRLRATAIVDPDITFDEMRVLDRAGFVGIRFSVGNLANPPDLQAPEWRRVLNLVIDLDWHVHFFARPEHTPGIVEALSASGVKLVVDHFGARDATCGEASAGFAAILRALGNGRTWVRLSGPYWSGGLDHASLAARFLSLAGPSRLLWGSDWPWTGSNGQLRFDQTLAWLTEWIPDPAARIEMDRAAMEFYRFPTEST